MGRDGARTVRIGHLRKRLRPRHFCSSHGQSSGVLLVAHSSPVTIFSSEVLPAMRASALGPIRYGRISASSLERASVASECEESEESEC